MHPRPETLGFRIFVGGATPHLTCDIHGAARSSGPGNVSSPDRQAAGDSATSNAPVNVACVVRAFTGACSRTYIDTLRSTPQEGF